MFKPFFLILLFIPHSIFCENYFNYSVERYDSIKKIADKFGIDQEFLVEKNNLEGVKILYVDQLLLIPVVYEKSRTTPIISDLKTIIDNPRGNWRNPLFELYSWNKNSNVLIFDTINYSFQSIMFKRLAFFIEKNGYTGSIYSLKEIEEEKGWNGHDYNSYDLARFFNIADKEKKELTRGEEILLDILLNNGILSKNRYGYHPHGGAVISCSKDSYYNQRKTILYHETLHGLYFTSPNFREFTKNIWNSMDYQSKRIWRMYMEVLGYNDSDLDLVMNEFMAYMLQVPEEDTYTYLIDIVWYRLWDYFPDKREQINRFFNSSPKPYSRQIKEFNRYIKILDIQ